MGKHKRDKEDHSTSEDEAKVKRRRERSGSAEDDERQKRKQKSDSDDDKRRRRRRERHDSDDERTRHRRDDSGDRKSRRRRGDSDEERSGRRRRDASDEETSGRRRRGGSEEEKSRRRKRDGSDEERSARRRKEGSDEERSARRRKDDSDEEKSKQEQKDDSDDEKSARPLRDDSDEDRSRRKGSKREDRHRRKRGESDEDESNRRRDDSAEKKLRRKKTDADDKTSRRRPEDSADSKSRRRHHSEEPETTKRREDYEEPQSRRKDVDSGIRRRDDSEEERHEPKEQPEGPEEKRQKRRDSRDDSEEWQRKTKKEDTEKESRSHRERERSESEERPRRRERSLSKERKTSSKPEPKEELKRHADSDTEASDEEGEVREHEAPKSYYQGDFVGAEDERRGGRRSEYESDRRRDRRDHRDDDRDRRGRDYGRRDEERHDRGSRRDRETRDRRDGGRDRREERDRDKENERRDRDRHREERKKDDKEGKREEKGAEEKPKEQPSAPAAETARAPTLGAYVPPAKLRMMQNAIQDKSSASYQRLAWEALKKSINGLINKVNVSNISVIVRELFKENLIRGRGILCRSIMQAQTASPTYTNVFAALVAIINTKFPNIGELLLKRLILQFRRGYKRNDKQACLSAVKFIAHLVNQQVAHEVLALELLTLLIEHPTSHSIEVAIAFLKEVGARLDEVSPRGAHAIFERLRYLLHEGELEKRVQYMIEVMFQLRKDKYEKYPAVIEELDLVEEEDQFTHLITLDEEIDAQDTLNIFKMDQEYIANEEKYAALRKEILDESEEESGDEEGDDDEDSDEEKEEEKEEDGSVKIFDKTETNLLALRRTIYLTIQSSLDYEECCHKLLKTNLPEGQESELCHMILDCCAQQRTYEKFFGLLAQRFCAINMKYVTPFEEIFKNTYDTVHRLDTNKLRNVAKFFAHLLFTDSISWTILEHIRLTEEDTTSSSRIFIKILCQELAEYMGLVKLVERFNDKTLKPYFEGLFPRDSPKNTRFSINFFTSIGLGGLTDELREHLKPKQRAEQA